MDIPDHRNILHHGTWNPFALVDPTFDFAWFSFGGYAEVSYPIQYDDSESRW